jgi:hypothetical protein
MGFCACEGLASIITVPVSGISQAQVDNINVVALWFSRPGIARWLLPFAGNPNLIHSNTVNRPDGLKNCSRLFMPLHTLWVVLEAADLFQTYQ